MREFNAIYADVLLRMESRLQVCCPGPPPNVCRPTSRRFARALSNARAIVHRVDDAIGKP